MSAFGLTHLWQPEPSAADNPSGTQIKVETMHETHTMLWCMV